MLRAGLQNLGSLPTGGAEKHEIHMRPNFSPVSCVLYTEICEGQDFCTGVYDSRLILQYIKSVRCNQRGSCGGSAVPCSSWPSQALGTNKRTGT